MSTLKSAGGELAEFSKVIARSTAGKPSFFRTGNMIKVFAITLRKIAKFLQKAELKPNGVPIRLVFFLCIAAFSASAQVERPVRVSRETLSVKPDTVSFPPAALSNPSDTTQQPSDSTLVQKKGDIETTINYSATDSIVSSLDGKKIWLYGDAKITYGIIELAADKIVIDYGNNTLTANGTRDSLGQRIGFPVFKNGAEVYETRDIVYNFKSKRAKISEVVTQQGEGIIHGDAVFKNERNELLTRGNIYTTCNLEHPHFAIRSTKVKAILKDKIVSGPFYMEFNSVPIYPMGFAFGMFPSERESKSGIIFPSYGEERRRGFNLRNGGYFFDINEYIKLTITGDLYSKGGHAVRANSNYNKRYAYSGSFSFSYSKTPRTFDKIEDRSFINDYSLNWSHSPQSRGTGRFAASVGAATSTYNLNNNLFLNNIQSNPNAVGNTNRRMQSNVSYSKTFRGTPISFGLNANHSQDLITRRVDLLLPSLTFNVNNLYPFQQKGVSKPGPIENLNVRYTMSGENKITNNLGRIIQAEPSRDSVAAFTVENLSTFWSRGTRSMRHEIPISTSAKVFRYFTLAPSVQYREGWYWQKFAWGFDDNNAIVKLDTIKGFSRVATYSMGASLNTRIYGTVFFKKGKIKALRHVINPSISYNYTPGQYKNQNYFQKLVNAETGLVTYKSRHEGLGGNDANLSESQSIGFGINNNFEMKVKSEKDTVARKVTLLNQLSLASSYNFVADSFNLSPISMSANTNVLNNKLNINAGATLDPYIVQNGFRRNEFAWRNGSLGRITTANIAMSTNLNPAGQKSDAKTQDKIVKSDLSEADKQYMLNNPNNYVDFTIPWNLRVSYSLSYSDPLGIKGTITQTLQFNGDLSLSEQWKVTFNSGFDLKVKQFTQTNLQISRDLHCWTMSLNWTPFGTFTSYDFRINVKSSILQDLKMERRKPFFDNF
jgi:hypothetical protein